MLNSVSLVDFHHLSVMTKGVMDSIRFLSTLAIPAFGIKNCNFVMYFVPCTQSQNLNTSCFTNYALADMWLFLGKIKSGSQLCFENLLSF